MCNFYYDILHVYIHGSLATRSAVLRGSSPRITRLVFHSVILTPDSLAQSFCHAPSSCGAYPLIEITFSAHVGISRRRSIFYLPPRYRRDIVNFSFGFLSRSFFYFVTSSFRRRVFRWCGVISLGRPTRLHVNLKYHSKGRLTRHCEIDNWQNAYAWARTRTHTYGG